MHIFTCNNLPALNPSKEIAFRLQVWLSKFIQHSDGKVRSTSTLPCTPSGIVTLRKLSELGGGGAEDLLKGLRPTEVVSEHPP